LAVNDRIISKSPYDGVVGKRKRVLRTPANIPTLEPFQAIVAEIRMQKFTDHAQDSADLAEFLGLAGVGETESGRLRWTNVDFRWLTEIKTR